ncbi:hypothetical protein QYE76_063126 [Lolium multiflorum]|uniref:Uncharacterized protein n=1 Tax=Lolium multiflorum TaxID=4521 RepID=A0AAD8S3Z4_LOLMU|nr:hypothetical protein QYE76_063126 [Lolium multiflorum]
MDSDEEEEQMFVELMQEEMAAAAQDEEHMMILGCLASMYADWQLVDVVGRHQKCTVAMRMLAYGAPGDTADDYLRMAESTALDCFYRFCRAVIAVFGDYYLRSPTVEDTERILATNEARGFPGCLEALTACIGNGRTVRLRGRECTRVTKKAL